MEQIPTEVIEKIAETFQLHKWMDNVMWNENQRQRTAAEYGYRLASPCALCEGKEKEIAELKAENEKLIMLTRKLLNK